MKKNIPYKNHCPSLTTKGIGEDKDIYLYVIWSFLDVYYIQYNLHGNI